MIRAALVSAACSVAFFVLVVLSGGYLASLGADPSLIVGLVAAELTVAMALLIKWVAQPPTS